MGPHPTQHYTIAALETGEAASGTMLVREVVAIE